jgi:hypothetical protein
VTATVPLYDLPVNVVNSAGQPVVATLTATETTSNPSPNTAICTNGGGAGTAATIGLVTTSATGTSTTAVPLGHWTINATSGSKHGTVKIWRRITGLFNVTSSGATTGSAIPSITVTVS